MLLVGQFHVARERLNAEIEPISDAASVTYHDTVPSFTSFLGVTIIMEVIGTLFTPVLCVSLYWFRAARAPSMKWACWMAASWG